jgi:hypothetical protein
MRRELDQKLCEEFPLLYRDGYKSKDETCMYWGFACGDGWFDIIYRLSEKLEALISLLPDDGNRPCAAQVKEKFGGLNFYMSQYTEGMSDFIAAAGKESYNTCEDCGSKEDTTTEATRYWIKTLCPKCREIDRERLEKKF